MKQKIGYFLLGLLYAFIFYVNGIIGIIETTISLILYCILFFFIYSLWEKFRKREPLNFVEFGKKFIYKICLFIYTIAFIIWGFAFYNNSINPATMPQFTISNGQKTVVFQAMSHIARPDFYKQVEQEIRDFKTSSGVLFYEGVKEGTKESNDKFDQALGVNFTPDLYKNMSRLYGVTFQDNSKLLGLVNNLDFNVDLTLDEVVKIYEEKVKNNGTKNVNNQEVINASDEIIAQLSTLNDRELKILVYINQAILNLIIKNDKEMKKLLENFGNPDLLDVILDERNKNLADNIEKSEYNKIFITYGLLHFEGVLKLLQESDSKWKIISTKELYPISEKKF
nr:hypothetical protein [Candidatus Gracilibacteria bacterium]